MCFLWSGIFWGIILVLIGLSVIINIIFHVHIPIVRIIFALILIYLGIQVLTGGSWCRGKSNRVFFKEEITAIGTDRNDYSIIFGKGTIDLTNIPAETLKKNYKIATAFGSSIVIIPSEIPIILRVSSAFGGVNLPNGSTISFGEYIYKNKAYKEQSDAIKVKIDVVFGGCSVVEK